MKATLIRDAYGRRAIVTEDKALRLFPDPHSVDQKTASWWPVTASQREALLATAVNAVEVEYDAEASRRYGQPIWH